MKWSISFNKQAQVFTDKHKIREEVFELIRVSIQKFQGEDVSIDIKKMKGEWSGFYRIRKGKYRIIASFDFEMNSVFIEVVDWRGNIY